MEHALPGVSAALAQVIAPGDEAAGPRLMPGQGGGSGGDDLGHDRRLQIVEPVPLILLLRFVTVDRMELLLELEEGSAVGEQRGIRIDRR